MQYKGYPPASFLEQAKKRHKYFRSAEEVIVLDETEVDPGSKSLSEVITHPLLLNIVERCLQWNPRKRVTALEAKTHPFFDCRIIESPAKSTRAKAPRK